MKITSIKNLRTYIQNVHPRTRKAQLNTVLGIAIKGCAIVVSLLLVPLTIDYLSKEVYGTWLTISAVISMVAFFDIGIGNGLRNKFSEAVTKKDNSLARAYVSTAYFIFGFIQLVFVLCFLITYKYIPWQRVFNTSIDNNQLQLVVLLTTISLSIKLVLDIVSYVLFALQESSKVGFINLMSNILSLIGTYILTIYTKSSLLSLALVVAMSPLLILSVSGLILFNGRLKDYRPSINFLNIRYARSLLSLGYQYFIIQLAIIVVFYTDNILITQFFGPSEVATYNVVFRYFNAVNVLFTIIITPYLPAFSEAFVNNDIKWMIQTYNHLRTLWVGLAIVIVIMVIMSQTVYSIWVGDRVIIPMRLTVCMGLFVVISCWNSITVTVINGGGRIKLQLYYALLSAAVNIPLAVLFGRTLAMGSAGIILATGVSLLFGSVIGDLQAKKLIHGDAKGIWNR